jgi:N-acyl-D-aspartate/D-glutamate deacylase
MRDKGRLRVGADADITVFDLTTVGDAATYTQPTLPSFGMRYVLVNGTVLVNEGKVEPGVRAGREIGPERCECAPRWPGST